MLAVLRDLGLEKYIDKTTVAPEPANRDRPTKEEIDALDKWKEGDAKARTRIELSIGDAEMIHICGATTAKEMWNQLSMVKESKGRLGVLATRRALYRASAEEGFDMVTHVSMLRGLQHELHVMENLVSDEDFVMILLTSLPESWDNYTGSYLGSSSNKPTITSHELIAVLLEEDRRRKGRNGESAGTALHAHRRDNGGNSKDKDCYNCNKKGHIKSECWAKGGGKEGQGPKGRKGTGKRKNQANQAQEVNSSLNDMAYMTTTYGDISKFDWLLDSGTTSHICTVREAFTDFQSIKETLNGVGKQGADVLGRGTVNIKFECDGKEFIHHLRNVLYTPDAPNCLLSLSRIDDSGGRVDFGDGKCWIKNKDGKVVGMGDKHQRLYLLKARAILEEPEHSNYASTRKLTWDQWHRRYGHISVTTLQQLDRESLVNGLSIDQSSIPSKSCDACTEAKQAHKPFPQEAENRSNIPGERVVSDVWGPARVVSIGGWKYYISFGDDCVRYITALFLREKGEAPKRIKECVAKIKQRFGKAPSYLRVDNGKELVNDEVKEFCAQEGITIEASAPYSPSQNGIAERYNRTLIELVRAMLLAKGLPTFLWDEAVSHATYIRNRSPTRALKGKTPYEAWTGKKPDVSHFREFGCDVWVLDENKNRSKLAPKSKKMVFVGFMEGSKAVRYWDKGKRNIKVSRNVSFNENEEPGEVTIVEMPGLEAEGEIEELATSQTTSDQPEKMHITPKTSNEPIRAEPVPPNELETTRNLRNKTKVDYRRLNDPSLHQPSVRSKAPSTPIPSPDVSRPTEASKAKTTPREKANLAIESLKGIVLEEEFAFSANEEGLPKNYEEAITGDEGEQWKAAMDEEIGTLGKMGTWKMEELPPDRKAIGCKWVFAKKRDENGRVIKFKARLVAQGFSQKPGTDYNNDGTFAPVMRFETLRTLLAYAAVHNLKLRQFDVKSAYLHGTLNEIIFMNQPPGYNDNSGRVCLLIRSLYGLKQAGNVWNQELNRVLQKIKFGQLKSDYCCYIKRLDDNFTALLVWVDDFLSLSTLDKLNDILEIDLQGHFEVKSLGRPNLLLGMKVLIGINFISLSQSHYIDSLLEKYGLSDANPVTTPMDPNVKLDINANGDADSDETKSGQDDPKITHGYAQLIGSLMYLAIGTRPDIAYAVNRLAQFTSNPRSLHWTAVKRVFRYLKYTKNFALTYGGDDDTIRNTDLNFFCDADWANDTSDRKSISGYVTIVAGGAVSWSSKKQQTVALSTAEAEYVAATHIAKQVLWHRTLFEELDFHYASTSTIFTDNQAAISISHHPEFHSRTKHIDIAHHFLRDLISEGTINTVYVNTRDNLADLFTKGLSRDLHDDLTSRIGVLSD
jgi:hypothetical protein